MLQFEGNQLTGNDFHQGDTQWFGITSIPKGAKKIEKRFIAASERSGSFHALFGNYEMYESADVEGLIIDVKEDCILNHSLQSLLEGTGVSMDISKVLEKKDHRHTVVPRGIYAVGIQPRFNPILSKREDVQD